MRILTTCKDGGAESTVWAHVLFEIKGLASVMLLRFEGDSREAYHTHAFDSISWVLRGKLVERFIGGLVKIHRPSTRPVHTKREHFREVSSVGTTWVLTFRGPWQDPWYESVDGKIIRLTHGRKVVEGRTK